MTHLSVIDSFFPLELPHPHYHQLEASLAWAGPIGFENTSKEDVKIKIMEAIKSNILDDLCNEWASNMFWI